MTNTDIYQLKADVSGYIDHVIETDDTVVVSTDRGDAVLLTAEKYGGIMETLYLLSVPGMREKLENGMNTSDEETESFDWRNELK